MGYQEWFEAHSNKHLKLTQKLSNAGMNQDEIIAYFRFENMCEHEPDFCELYKQKQKCHDMENLNCYLCACPNFRFYANPITEDGKTLHSNCSIDSKDGAIFEHEGHRHQDCSGCSVPHHETYIQKHFSLEWKKIMHQCSQA